MSLLLTVLTVWVGSCVLLLVVLWFYSSRVSKRCLEAPRVDIEEVLPDETVSLSGEIAELHELMESYRRRSHFIPLQPVASAYAEAADQLEEIIRDKLAAVVVGDEAMKVSECMTRHVQVAQLDEPIRKAAQFMFNAGAGSIPVCEGDRLIGMVTDRDLAVRALAEGRGPETPLREIMTNDLVCCFEDEDVESAVQKMRDKRVRRLLVVSRNDEKLVGILSLGDVIRSKARLAKQAGEEVTQPSPLQDKSRER